MYCVAITYIYKDRPDELKAMYFDDPMLAVLWAIAMSMKQCLRFKLRFFKYEKPTQRVQGSSFQFTNCF